MVDILEKDIITEIDFKIETIVSDGRLHYLVRLYEDSNNLALGTKAVVRMIPKGMKVMKISSSLGEVIMYPTEDGGNRYISSYRLGEEGEYTEADFWCNDVTVNTIPKGSLWNFFFREYIDYPLLRHYLFNDGQDKYNTSPYTSRSRIYDVFTTKVDKFFYEEGKEVIKIYEGKEIPSLLKSTCIIKQVISPEEKWDANDKQFNGRVYNCLDFNVYNTDYRVCIKPDSNALIFSEIPSSWEFRDKLGDVLHNAVSEVTLTEANAGEIHLDFLADSYIRDFLEGWLNKNNGWELLYRRLFDTSCSDYKKSKFTPSQAETRHPYISLMLSEIDKFFSNI